MNNFKVAWLCAVLLLLCGIKTYAQQSPSSGLKLFFEKVYLHTDREVYLQGDTLWFKAYLINGQNNKPTETSKTLYVELINQDSAKVALRHLIRLNRGVGHGDFTLTDSIPAGNYTLRAYTNWMRNFGDSFVFEKQVTILGDVLPASGAEVSGIKTSAPRQPKAIASLPVDYTTSMQFYPESGSLVEGVSAIVAVKAQNSLGKGIAAIGSIISSTGDTVSKFSCDSLGMGLFALLPVKGQTYKAIVKNKSFTLPTALKQGLTLAIRQSDTLMRAVISSSDTTKRKVTLVVKHGGVTVINQTIQLLSGQIAVRIPVSSLPQGISSLTLYDE